MIVSKTPLRISFVGGGTDIGAFYKTDYGAVVSATINKYIYVTVHKRFDSSIRVSYTKTEIVDNVDDLRHDIIRACLKMAGILHGVEVTTIGEVPGGTGLGSSSSLTVGVLNALYAFKGVSLSAQELMERACAIEIDVLKAPIGKQDQAAAAYGGMNYFRFETDGRVARCQLRLPEAACESLERKLMMLYTGQRRDAVNVLKSQVENTPQKMDTLRYMRNQADKLCQAMTSGACIEDMLGGMLDDGWQKKQTLTAAISNSGIDALYIRAKEAGAQGGKILGAGGGGFLLLYCDEKEQPQVRKKLRLKEITFHFTQYGSRIVYFG